MNACPDRDCLRPAAHPLNPTAHVKRGPTCDDAHDRNERSIP
jgi:hypothetical protein